MNKRISFFCLFYICLSFLLNANAANFVVVIDAGHGGKDGGAVRGNIKEKNINLGVALALGRQIEDNMKDVRVIYTRKSDVFVNLYKRSEIANRAKANLFISIHTNSTAARTTSASGADTYILGLAKSEENLSVAKRENSVIKLEDNYTARYEGFDPNSPESNILFEFMTNKYMDQSLEFATYVQNGFSRVAKRVNRGVAQAGFLVLRESGMPSVLIELGFINNPSEAEFLASKSGQQRMAEAIYSGFRQYKDKFDKSQGIRVSNRNNIPAQDFTDTVEMSKNDQVKRNTNTNTRRNETKKETKNIEYRVQFLTSSSKYADNSKAFKGLSPVSYYIDRGIYKYTYGSYATERDAVKAQREIRSKFRDAFVVKLENGQRK